MIKTPLKGSTRTTVSRQRAISKLGIIHNSSLRQIQSNSGNMQRCEHARTDVKTRAVVDKSLELERVLGPVIAAGFLQKQHVPFNVAERVLLHPEQRRKA